MKNENKGTRRSVIENKTIIFISSLYVYTSLLYRTDFFLMMVLKQITAVNVKPFIDEYSCWWQNALSESSSWNRSHASSSLNRRFPMR
jgi:hypothetical protein